MQEITREKENIKNFAAEHRWNVYYNLSEL